MGRSWSKLVEVAGGYLEESKQGGEAGQSAEPKCLWHWHIPFQCLCPLHIIF